MSGSGASAGFNHAVTLLDSLDTLWMVGMRDEFNDAVECVDASLSFFFFLFFLRKEMIAQRRNNAQSLVLAELCAPTHE